MTLTPINSTTGGTPDGRKTIASITRPSASQVRWSFLGLAFAAQTADLFPDGAPSTAAGAGIALAVLGDFIAGCVYRKG
ncbi:hypothetical protein [Streptomyces malaysiensis]|uniref:hypothetical protein n=1 Tax=Streptomyces malaysiensis TaxID=92644 RepID=UPI000853C925|nr:hypothetical protein [Streptomyces sp. SPMA113]